MPTTSRTILDLTAMKNLNGVFGNPQMQLGARRLVVDHHRFRFERDRAFLGTHQLTEIDLTHEQRAARFERQRLLEHDLACHALQPSFVFRRVLVGRCVDLPCKIERQRLEIDRVVDVVSQQFDVQNALRRGMQS